MTDTVGRCGYCAAEPESAIEARVRAQVAAETAALRRMIEWAIRSADWEPGDAQRALRKLRDDYARLAPSGTPGNPADHPESRWQYVEPTDG